MTGVFLAADWRHLAMLNYRVPTALLERLVPHGTELDLWQGAAYVSLVGFMFHHTRVFGIPVPFHGSFEEVNLRMYVRRVVNGEVRRAVTFIRELVPRVAIATAARLAYNEPYRALPMSHRIDVPEGGGGTVEYSWKADGAWARLRLDGVGASIPAQAGSEEEFITRHHWGYTRQRDGSTIEYEVRHPAWTVRSTRSATVEGDLAATYGHEFASALSGPPYSAFVADGSSVTVHLPRRLPA
ncbi:MAG TPA: DUF2071 domain-containing protein [Gemmatimonadaceae bacterium]|nr:DUF2071 domain-containing protein [Gemmatimonadaceae bacterium]